jgi:DNA processing protein
LTQEACAAALARLPGMGPAALVSIFREHDPVAAWELILHGQLIRPRERARHQQGPSLLDPGAGLPEGTDPSEPGSWARAARRLDVAGYWERATGSGIEIAWFGSDRYPSELLADPSPPGVLFWRGSLHCLGYPRVAIVGTRNATPDGRAIAFELGRDLAEAGVCVISGLALGIDGAAHHGVLDAGPTRPCATNHDPPGVGPPPPAPPLGVAASGVDVPYPRQQADLWDRVCRAGAVVSETPPGEAAQAWRFPTRNRVIAALSQMVVVVESHLTGGSLITAEAALERGIEVRAVPGPVRSPASEGSNQLLYDGPGPVRSAQDVLDALGFFRPRGEGRSPRAHRRDDHPDLPAPERSILGAIGWRPASVGQIVERSGFSLGEVATALDSLEARGLIARHGGWWTRAE